MTTEKTTINYDGYTLTLEAARYSDNGALALVLVVESTGELYNSVTVNIPGTLMFDPEYDVILDTNNNSAELLQLVIDTGLVEEDNYTQNRSGFCVYPVHSLTEKGIAWVKEQLDKE